MQTPDKVLIVITKGNWGGAQRYVFDLATNIDPARYTVAVAMGEGEELGKRLIERGVQIIPLHFSARDVSKNDWHLFRELFSLIKSERPTVLHLNSSKVGLLGAFAGRVLRVPRVIFTAHGWASREERPWYERVAIATLHWLTILLSHQTVCVSRNVAHDFIRWPLTERRISVIYNGITERQLPSRDMARAELLRHVPALASVAPDAFWIGTIAELHRNKGIDRVIAALPEILHLSPLFIVIGEGEERATLEAQVRFLKLERSVVFIGAIRDAARLIPAFDLFTLTSRKEGLPYVLLEAGLAGVPVLASEVGGIPEVIQTMKGGLLIDASVARNVAAAIALMAADRERTQSFASRLKGDVQKNFSTAEMVRKTIALYRVIE